MELFHENPVFETVKSKVIISLFETVRLSISISPRNLYNSLKSIKEIILNLLTKYEPLHWTVAEMPVRNRADSQIIEVENFV